MTADFRHDDPGTPEETWRNAPRLAAASHLDLTEVHRVIVVAAHPDDETLMAGGLIAEAAHRDLPVEVIVASDGEASHPDSPTHTRADLASRRARELPLAVAHLHPGAIPRRLMLPDGDLASHRDEIRDLLVDLIGSAGPATLLVSTYSRDGHPDHEAIAAAANSAAWRTDARHLQAPIWLWHWGTPEDLLDEERIVQLELGPESARAKTLAMDEHVSQTAALSERPGDEVLLTARFLEHFTRRHEHFVEPEPGEPPAFEALHEGVEDPWQTLSSRYEERKRALTMAMLPARRYRLALELGCSIGTLARELAVRAENVIGVDESAAALDRAAHHLAGLPVELQQRSVPEEWSPDWHGADLVVISEIGYFLSPLRLRELADRIRRSAPVTVIACHWRHEIRGWPLDALGVHTILDDVLGVRRAVYVDDDVEIVLHVLEAESRD